MLIHTTLYNATSQIASCSSIPHYTMPHHKLYHAHPYHIIQCHTILSLIATLIDCFSGGSVSASQTKASVAIFILSNCTSFNIEIAPSSTLKSCQIFADAVSASQTKDGWSKCHHFFLVKKVLKKCQKFKWAPKSTETKINDSKWCSIACVSFPDKGRMKEVSLF